MVIAAAITSIFPFSSDRIRESNAISLTSTVYPASSKIFVTISISKPTNVPSSLMYSKGGKSADVPTMILFSSSTHPPRDRPTISINAIEKMAILFDFLFIFPHLTTEKKITLYKLYGFT